MLYQKSSACFGWDQLRRFCIPQKHSRRPPQNMAKLNSVALVLVPHPLSHGAVAAVSKTGDRC